MEIDNCVVCFKYLKEIGERESKMCNKCDNITSKIANDIDAQKIWDATEPKKYKRDDKLTQCMIGRDAECNHQKCPITEKDMENGKYCTLPLIDYRQ
jgi:hypothetical protein